MRKLFTRLCFLMLLMALLPLKSLFAQQTTVFVVRHAEKDLSNPSEKNPALSATGVQRAMDLRKVLKKENIAAIYTTDYIRTRETAQPLAKKMGVAVQDYKPTDYRGLAARIKSGDTGKSVLVVGHSNTVLEIVQALGGHPPVKELNEEKDYDYLFKVVLKPQGAVETITTHYGKKARKE